MRLTVWLCLQLETTSTLTSGRCSIGGTLCGSWKATAPDEENLTSHAGNEATESETIRPTGGVDFAILLAQNTLHTIPTQVDGHILMQAHHPYFFGVAYYACSPCRNASCVRVRVLSGRTFPFDTHTNRSYNRQAFASRPY